MLPESIAYSDHVKIIETTNLSLDDARPHATWLDQPRGGNKTPRRSCHPRHSVWQIASNSVNTATSEELCRNYAKGRCKFGAKCKFVHREKPAGNPNQQRPKCTHCNKLGHLEEKCWNFKKHPELNPHTKRENGALVSIDDLAHATHDNVNDKIGNDVAAAIATIKFHQVKDN